MLVERELASEIEAVVHPRPGVLRRELGSIAVLLLTLSSLSPVVSVFGVGGDVLHQVGPAAGALFALALLAALVWAVVYAELGSAFPYAGGDYVGVGRVLGPEAGVMTLAIWAATGGPSAAFALQTFAVYVHELAPAWPESLITFAGLAGALIVALMSVRRGALITGIFLAVESLAVVALIVVGAGRPQRGWDALIAHPLALGASGGFVPVTLGAMALAMVSTVYATVGGNQAIFFGEELRDPHRRMGPVIIAACLIGAVTTALPVLMVAISAPDLHALLASPAPFAQFMTAALGRWAGPALSAGVATALFNAAIVSLMGSARQLFSLGRDGFFTPRLNRALASVGADSGTPVPATLALGAFTGLCCLLPSHSLLVFMTGLLVYGWSAVCLAVLIGRLKGQIGAPGMWRAPLYPLAPVLGLVMAAVFTVADLADADAGRPSVLLLGLVIVAALIWHRVWLKPHGWRPTLGDVGGGEV
ncbi:MAG: APC family permease [Alphaproteobacteria bacterium]|nr:APC family permease [Alphaproteobacteria bacterium]